MIILPETDLAKDEDIAFKLLYVIFTIGLKRDLSLF